MDPQMDLLGASPGIALVREKIQRLIPRQSGARRLAPVLVEGETGTGKGLVARLLHRVGPRRDGPFVDVNCAAIPDNLLEAEMFGFERGAFTDARQAKAGLFQAAHGGTIFLDEVGLLPEALQAKLLKVIEERGVRRLGSTRSEQVDVWIIAATNEDLALATRSRRFREDLYHRLAVVTLPLPPLRERGEDVLLLADHFLARACAEYGLPQKALTPDARAALLGYAWPGNIRELSNVIERVALLWEAPLVTAEMLGLPGPSPVGQRPSTRGARAVAPEPGPAGDERERLLAALQETDWNVSRAAARLGLSRNTIRYRIEKYGLRRGAAGDAPVPPVPVAEPRPTRPRAVERVEALAAPIVRWERRRITFLRAAVVVPEPVAFEPELSRVFEVLVDKAQSFGGQIEELSRAAIVAVFGLEPTEDAPRRAANAAMAIVKGMERARRTEGRSPWRLKLAVHVAEVLVGRVNGGTQIEHEAKRGLWPVLDDLIERAAADTIVVSDTAAPFLERHFDLLAVAEAAAPYRLIGRERTGLGPGGRMAQFVGRRHELELIWSRFEAAARGQGQVVGVSGEAGMGKSRLLFEFQQSLGDRPLTYLEAHCVSYGTSIPYLPVLDLLRGAADIAESDTPDVIAAKVRMHVAEVGMSEEASVPYLLHFLGIKEGAERLASEDPEALKAKIFDVLRQLALRTSRLRPLVLVVEDLHWVDRTSEEYLGSLVDGMPGAPVLFISTYRPGYRPPWMGKSFVTQIALQALEPDEGLSLVRFALGSAGRVPESLARLVLTKGEGNPFFLEELARAVREQGWESSSTLVVPDTIQEVLLARIDRLEPEDKRLLQAASVVGANVSFEVLQVVGDVPPDELRRRLARLHAAEFVSEAGLGPELEYAFRHTLTHEVAYGSLLPEQRRALHARIVEAIERLHGPRRIDHVERLADHAFRGALWERAVGYLRDAGARAAARSAHREAVAWFEQALEALGHLPHGRWRAETAIDLRFDLRNSLHPLGEHGRILDHLREAKLLAEEIAEPRRLGWVFSYLTQYSRLMGNPDEAIDAGQRALTIAADLDDVGLRVATNTHLGPVHRMLGNYRRAIATLRETVAALTGDRRRARFGLAGLPSVICRNNLVLCHAELGEFADGAALGEEAIDLAEAADDPYSIISAYAAVGTFAFLRGDHDAAITRLERGVELCRQWNIPVWLSVVASSLGAAYGRAGRLTEAVSLLEQAVEEPGPARALGHSISVVWLGEAYLAAGRLDGAAVCAARGLELARRQRERGHEAYALRLIADIAALGTPPAVEGAERSYREALGLAEKLGMRPLVAHCQQGLGELYRHAGLPGAAACRDAAAALYREMGMVSRLNRLEEQHRDAQERG